MPYKNQSIINRAVNTSELNNQDFIKECLVKIGVQEMLIQKLLAQFDRLDELKKIELSHREAILADTFRNYHIGNYN
jgi:hypothetical protein